MWQADSCAFIVDFYSAKAIGSDRIVFKNGLAAAPFLHHLLDVYFRLFDYKVTKLVGSMFLVEQRRLRVKTSIYH